MKIRSFTIRSERRTSASFCSSSKLQTLIKSKPKFQRLEMLLNVRLMIKTETAAPKISRLQSLRQLCKRMRPATTTD